MKEETLDCFSFISDVVVVIFGAAPVLRQLVLRNLGLRLKMSPWAASIYLRKRKTVPNPEVHGKGDHQ